MPVRCLLNAHQMLKCKKTILPATGKWYNAFTMGIEIPTEPPETGCPNCTNDMPNRMLVQVNDPSYPNPTFWVEAYRIDAKRWRINRPQTTSTYAIIEYCKSPDFKAECQFYSPNSGYDWSPTFWGCNPYTFTLNGRSIFFYW